MRGASRAFPIVPHATNDQLFDYLQVGAGGTVTVVLEDGSLCQYTVGIGDYIWTRGKRVNAVGTAASLIVGHTG